MSEEIKPALTAEQWAKGPPGVFGWDDESVFVDFRDGTSGIKPGEEAAVIAAANDALPDSDPRKITRMSVAALRVAMEEAAANGNTPLAPFLIECEHLVAALESYLPPP